MENKSSTYDLVAFGQSFHLGMPYNAVDGIGIELPVFTEEQQDKFKPARQQKNLSVWKYVESESTKDKGEALDVSARLQLEFSVVKAEGEGHYFKTKTTFSNSVQLDAVCAFHGYSETIGDSVYEIGIDRLDALIKAGATHIVTGVDWGRRVIVSFSRSIETSDDVLKASGSLKVDIQKVVSGSGAVDVSEKNNSVAKNLRFSMIGAIPVKGVIESLTDVHVNLEAVRKELKVEENFQVLKAYMTPLTALVNMKTLKTTIRVFNEIRDESISGFVTLLDRMANWQVVASRLKKLCEAKQGLIRYLDNHLDAFTLCVDTTKQRLQRNLTAVLPKVVSGVSKVGDLTEMLEWYNNRLLVQKADKWLKYKTAEIEMLYRASGACLVLTDYQELFGSNSPSLIVELRLFKKQDQFIEAINAEGEVTFGSNAKLNNTRLELVSWSDSGKVVQMVNLHLRLVSDASTAVEHDAAGNAKVRCYVWACPEDRDSLDSKVESTLMWQPLQIDESPVVLRVPSVPSLGVSLDLEKNNYRLQCQSYLDKDLSVDSILFRPYRKDGESKESESKEQWLTQKATAFPCEFQPVSWRLQYDVKVRLKWTLHDSNGKDVTAGQSLFLNTAYVRTEPVLTEWVFKDGYVFGINNPDIVWECQDEKWVKLAARKSGSKNQLWKREESGIVHRKDVAEPVWDVWGGLTAEGTELIMYQSEQGKRHQLFDFIPYNKSDFLTRIVPRHANQGQALCQAGNTIVLMSLN